MAERKTMAGKSSVTQFNDVHRPALQKLIADSVRRVKTLKK